MLQADKSRALTALSAIGGCCVVTILTLGLPLEVDAQGSNWRAVLKAEQGINARRIQAIDEEAEPYGQALFKVLDAIKIHNGKPPDPTNHSAVDAYNTAADRLDDQQDRLESRLKILEVEQDRLLARNREIDRQLKLGCFQLPEVCERDVDCKCSGNCGHVGLGFGAQLRCQPNS